MLTIVAIIIGCVWSVTVGSLICALAILWIITADIYVIIMEHKKDTAREEWEKLDRMGMVI